jgi:hypothetical protein
MTRVHFFLSKSYFCFIEAQIAPNEAKRFDSNQIEKDLLDVDLAGDLAGDSPETSPETCRRN